MVSPRRTRGGWASLAKRQFFTFLYLLYFLGVAAELGVHQELCLGQLRLCNTVPFLYKVKKAMPGWATHIFIFCELLLSGAFFLFLDRCEWCRQGLMKAK